MRCYDDAIRGFFPLNLHFWQQETGFSHILGSTRLNHTYFCVLQRDASAGLCCVS